MIASWLPRLMPDEKRLLSAGRDGVIRIWDYKSGDIVGLLRGHDDYIYSLAVSPDGDRIISGSGDKTVRIWETYPLRQRLRAMHKTNRVAEDSARAEP
jgi:WD40 repeat protein